MPIKPIDPNKSFNDLGREYYARKIDPGSYAGAAGTTGTVNVPVGAVVRSYAAQSGTSASTMTVPGVTGDITIPASSQYADVPDADSMLGPCTFVFTGTASYVVIWNSYG